MAYSRFYDTVAFDVRDNATMLFFARTIRVGGRVDWKASLTPAVCRWRGGEV